MLARWGGGLLSSPLILNINYYLLSTVYCLLSNEIHHTQLPL